MALSNEDIKVIQLTIINTLNERLETMNKKIAMVNDKADKANTRIVILVSFLAGSGVLGAAGYGIIKTFGGG